MILLTLFAMLAKIPIQTTAMKIATNPIQQCSQFSRIHWMGFNNRLYSTKLEDNYEID